MKQSRRFLHAVILFTTAFLINSACSTDDEAPAATCLLTKFTSVGTGFPNDGNVTWGAEFTYDETGNLTTYTSDGDEYTLTFKDGLITGQTSSFGNTEEWSYNENKLIKHIDGTNSNSKEIYTKDFTYNNRKLLTVKKVSTVDGEYLMTATYTGDNVTALVATDPADDNKVKQSASYSNFDNKNNPYLLVGKAMGNQSFFVDEYIWTEKFTGHNAKTIDDTYYGKSEITYEYDSNNNVTKMTEIFEDGGKKVISFEYACK